MTLRKSILLILGLGMIAALVACSSSSSTPPPPTIAITATSGGGQSQVVGMAFANPLVATVTSNGTASGTPSVTFTAPAATNGTFASTGTNTETDTAVAGVATSSVFTAGTAAGAYTVTATTANATTPATFALTNTSGAAANLAISSGNNQMVAVNGAYASLVAQVTDSDGNGVSGVAMTFTVTAGATGASGSFTSTSSGTESVNTDANGNATVSDLTANGTTGAFTVVAAPTTATLTPTSVTFTETNVTAATAPIAAGNYVFSVNGTNASGPFNWAGVFTVTTSGGVSTITAGEQDYSDYGEANFISAEPITGGTIAAVGGGDTNVLITLNFTDSYINGGAGNLTLDASMDSTTNGQLIEYDTWGSGSGQLKQQSSTAAPSAGYSFYLNGFDDPNGFPLVVGGVLNVSSATGSGSVFDANDGGALSSDQLFSATTFTGPDLMGLVTFTLTPSAGGTVIVDGYIVDSTHIYLVENWSDGFGATAGAARGQGANTGTFSSSSISGSTYAIVTEGNDVNGALDVAGALTFNSNGTVSGNLSFNDLVATNPPQGGAAITGGTYTIDASGTGNDGGTGRVTVTGVTDGATFTYNLQLYIDGSGNASVISMDANDGVAGPSAQQASATFTADTFTGPYSIFLTGFNTSELIVNSGSGTFFGEEDMVGVLTATPSSSSAGTVAGFFDSNDVQVGGGLTPDSSATASYATTSTNGVFTVTPPSGLFTFYMVDISGDGGLIENDNTGLETGIAVQVP
jgi:adhesin/invasin